jgi:polyvinyl alcohol dehydrogenase (cytochrome)
MEPEGDHMNSPKTLLFTFSALALLGAPIASAQPIGLPGVNVVPGDPHDWPMYNRDPEGTRWNFAENTLAPSTAAGIEVLWTFPTTGAVAGTPAVVNDVVYIADSKGHVYALNRDGTLRWRNDTIPIPSLLGVKATNSLLVTNRTIVFGDTAGQIHGLETDTGELRWTIRPGAGPLFPTGHPTQAIFGAGTMVGNYIAYGISSFEWAMPLINPAYPGYTFRGSVVLIDPADGRIVWQTFLVPETQPQPGGGFGPSGASVWGTPAYDRPTNTIFVGTSNNYGPPATDTSDALIAINASNGNFRWVRQMTPDDTWNMSHLPPGPGSPPDADFGDSPQLYRVQGRLVVAAGQKNGVFHAVDGLTGDSLTVPQQFLPGGILGGFHMDSAAAHGVNYATANFWPQAPFGPADGGAVLAISSSAGEELWRFNTPSAILAGAAVANGVVYVQAMDGQFYALHAGTGALLRQINSGGQSSGPSVSRGRIYLGTGDVMTPLFSVFGEPGPGTLVSLGLPE